MSFEFLAPDAAVAFAGEPRCAAQPDRVAAS